MEKMEIRNSTNSKVKFAKKVYFDNAFKENRGDLRNTWRIINEITSRKSKSSFVNELNSIMAIPFMIHLNYPIPLTITFVIMAPA